MREIIAYFFMIIGILIMVFGTLANIFLKDLFLRIHAMTKCSFTGPAAFLIGLIIYVFKLSFFVKFLLLILFLFFTGPIVSNVIAVSAVKNKVEFFKKDG
jgi:monovalent cation/proton antiporter MnhG/PhaG subunit